jgi:hypothetical protein
LKIALLCKPKAQLAVRLAAQGQRNDQQGFIPSVNYTD